MFVNGRMVLEETQVDNFIESLRLKIDNFLENDERFSKFKFSVDVGVEWECWNDETNCFWNEINISIINHSVDVEFKNGLSSKALTHFSYTTEGLNPQLVHMDGEFKFFYVFECGSYTITNPVTFQNNHDDGSFEDILEKEILI